MSVRINYTVNPDNLEELKDFFIKLGHYSIDTLQVRPIMDLGGNYRKQITEELQPRYNQIISLLSAECSKRGVKLLANTLDLSYQQESEDSDLAELVYTYISPNTANQMNLEWKNCTFQQYRRADKWSKRLWRAFFSKSAGDGWMKRSLKYDEV